MPIFAHVARAQRVNDMSSSRSIFTAIALLLAAGHASAAITRCEVQNPSDIQPRWLMFDTATGRASIEWMGNVLTGRITLTTPRPELGSSYNLVFPRDSEGDNRFEVIVFPTPMGVHRAIGVATKRVGGERHLYAGFADNDLVCSQTGM